MQQIWQIDIYRKMQTATLIEIGQTLTRSRWNVFCHSHRRSASRRKCLPLPQRRWSSTWGSAWPCGWLVPTWWWRWGPGLRCSCNIWGSPHSPRSPQTVRWRCRSWSSIEGSWAVGRTKNRHMCEIWSPINRRLSVTGYSVLKWWKQKLD